jgi:hypothetical protein
MVRLMHGSGHSRLMPSNGNEQSVRTSFRSAKSKIPDPDPVGQGAAYPVAQLVGRADYSSQ